MVQAQSLSAIRILIITPIPPLRILFPQCRLQLSLRHKRLPQEGKLSRSAGQPHVSLFPPDVSEVLLQKQSKRCLPSTLI